MLPRRLIRFLSGAPRGARAAAAADRSEPGWRPAAAAARRDLAPAAQARMRERAVELWETNLLAHRLVELPVAWLLAEGVRLAAPDPRAQTWLDEFWRDPVTDMRRNLPRMMREMALFGEQCWPAFVDPLSGRARLGYIDPCRIAEVTADPDNASQPVGVTIGSAGDAPARRYRTVVNGPETVFGPAARRLRAAMADGECFLFQRNRPMGATRGRSDLLPALEWLADYDRFMRGEVERAEFLRAFVWDVTVENADQDEIEKRAAEIGVPAPGAAMVHNQFETWRAVAPPLGGADVAAASRALRNHVLAGMGWPEHWFGSGGDVNRATAAEMGDPAFKALALRRREWTAILEEIGAFVVRRRRDPAARDPGAPLPHEQTPTVEWPELAPRDETRHARALADTVAAVLPALDRGLLAAPTALRLIRSVAERYGVEFDPESELDAARKPPQA